MIKIRHIFVLLLGLVAGTGGMISDAEATSAEIPFQGFLMDGESAVEGEQALTFTFTDCQTGDSLWTEDQIVTFTEGSFAVTLGSVESFPEDLTDFDLCLGMTLNGETLSTEISAVPQAMYAARAGEADYADVAGALVFSGSTSVSGIGSGLTSTGGTLQIDTSTVPQLAAANTFTGAQTFSTVNVTSANLGATGTISANGLTVSATELGLLDGKTSLVDTDDTGVITPTHLSAGNSPTDEYCLTYEGSATGFEWQSCSTSSIADDSLIFTDSDLSLYGWSTYNLPATANMVVGGNDEDSKGGGSILSFSESDATGGLDLTAIVNDATATSFGVSVNALTQTNATTVTTFPAGAQVFGVYDTMEGSPLLAVKAGTGTLALRNNETIDNDTDGTIALTGNVQIKSSGVTANELRLNDDDNTNYVALKSPVAVGTNVVWTLPSADATIAGQALTSNGAGTLSWGSVDTSTTNEAPITATYITQMADGTLSNEFALSTLATGLLKVTNGTGVLSTATATDYYAPGGADIAVSDGGTGASTLTQFGVLYGNGTSAIAGTTAGTSGQLLLGNTSAAPAFATMTGDATISAGGYLTIGPDTVALGTDTSGFFAAGDGENGNATGVACTGCIDFGDIADSASLDGNLTISQGTSNWSHLFTNTIGPAVTMTASGAVTAGGAAALYAVANNGSSSMPTIRADNSGTGAGVYGYTISAASYGVMGENTGGGAGVYGLNSSSGIGIRGAASGNGGTAGSFLTNGSNVTSESYGIALTNSATNTTQNGVDKFGISITSTGGWTGGNTADNFGIKITASGASPGINYGLHSTGTDYGAYVVSTANNGIGLYATSAGTGAQNPGVYGANTSTGAGVYGIGEGGGSGGYFVSRDPTQDILVVDQTGNAATNGVDGLAVTYAAASGSGAATMNGANIAASFSGADSDDIYRGASITVTNETTSSTATVMGLKVESGNSTANATPVDSLIALVGNDAGNTTSAGLYVLASAGTMTSGIEVDNLSSLSTMSDGLKIGSGVSTQTITRAINIATTAVTTDLTLQNSETIDNDTDGLVKVSGRLSGAQGASIPSANSLTIGSDGNYFQISGTTTINCINNTGWVGGSVVMLHFKGALTLTHNYNGGDCSGYGASFKPIKNSNQNVTQDTVFTLVYDATDAYWYEVSRVGH